MTEHQVDQLLLLARLQFGISVGIFVGVLIIIVTVISSRR